MYVDNVWQLLRSPFYLKIFYQRHILVEQCIRYVKSLIFCIFVKTVYSEKYFIKTVELKIMYIEIKAVENISYEGSFQKLSCINLLVANE